MLKIKIDSCKDEKKAGGEITSLLIQQQFCPCCDQSVGDYKKLKEKQLITLRYPGLFSTKTVIRI